MKFRLGILKHVARRDSDLAQPGSACLFEASQFAIVGKGQSGKMDGAHAAANYKAGKVASERSCLVVSRA